MNARFRYAYDFGDDREQVLIHGTDDPSNGPGSTRDKWRALDAVRQRTVEGFTPMPNRSRSLRTPNILNTVRGANGPERRTSRTPSIRSIHVEWSSMIPKSAG